MRNKLLTSIVAGFVLALIVYSPFSFAAANLSDAVKTLPQNEEWSVMAYKANGQNVGTNYLATPLNSSTATDYEKRILAISAQNQNPAAFSSENFVAKLESMFDGTQIGEPFLLNDDIFGILALKSAGISDTVISKSRAFILNNQNSDGGWGYAPRVGSDSNTTAMAVAALSLTGSVPANAYTYITSTQKPNGGYAYAPTEQADGASTAWVIMGLNTAKQAAPASAKLFLENLQINGGGFKWMPSDSAASPLVTAYAVIALSGKGIPVNAYTLAPTPPPAPKPAPTPQPIPPPAPHPILPPAQQPSPLPAPLPTPLPTPTISPAALTPIYRVAITYPGNKIYVGQVQVNAANSFSKTNQNFSSTAPTAMQALIVAMDQINLLYEIQTTPFGPFVKTINGYRPNGLNGWLYSVNGIIPQTASSNYMIKNGDNIQWFFGGPTTQPYE